MPKSMIVLGGRTGVDAAQDNRRGILTAGAGFLLSEVVVRRLLAEAEALIALLIDPMISSGVSLSRCSFVSTAANPRWPEVATPKSVVAVAMPVITRKPRRSARGN